MKSSREQDNDGINVWVGIILIIVLAATLLLLDKWTEDDVSGAANILCNEMMPELPAGKWGIRQGWWESTEVMTMEDGVVVRCVVANVTTLGRVE